MHRAGEMLRSLQLRFDERLVDDQLGGDVRQFTSLPGFHLLSHGLKVSVHSVDANSRLNLETTATLELTSEDERHPIEAALSSRDHQGWRASGPGPQTIRLVFDQPQRLRRINLVFNEAETSRTQEFVLRWRSEADPGFREIVRQQWNFSPPQTAREIEDYQVDLASVKVLELVIVPDIAGGNTRASLENSRLA